MSVVIAFTFTVVVVARPDVLTVVVVLAGVAYTTGWGVVTTVAGVVTTVVATGLCGAEATVSNVVRQLVHTKPTISRLINRNAFIYLYF